MFSFNTNPRRTGMPPMMLSRTRSGPAQAFLGWLSLAAIWAPAPVLAQCSGREGLKASCRARDSGNKLQAKVTQGVAGQRVMLCYDGGGCVTRFFNNRGKAKAAWSGVADGPHHLLATLPCGQDLTAMTSCATDPYQVQIQLTGQINGGSFSALGTGLADPATGVTLVTWEVDGLDESADPMALVSPTQVQGCSAMVAREVGGAINLETLSGGVMDIELVSLNLTSVGTLQVSGNVMSGHFRTEGELITPTLEGAAANVHTWTPRPRSGMFYSNQTWFFEPLDGHELVGRQDTVVYRPGNGQDLPGPQEQSSTPTTVYRYDALDRLVRTVRDDGAVRTAGGANRCHYWTATAPDESCAACPVAGGTTVCGKECSSDNDCAGYTANFACAGGGNCKVSYNPNGCGPCN